MKEQLISFETAKLAKEKGFDIECKLFYISKDRLAMAYNISAKESLSDNTQYNKYILVPTQSLLAKWLREVHNIDVEVNRTGEVKEPRMGYLWSIYSETKFDYTEDSYETYENALEIGLQEALKLIK